MGLPAAGFYGVLRPYKDILEKPVSERTEDESGKVAPMSFLWQSYRTGCWWYEAFEIVRRLALCGGINVWFPPETTSGVFLTVVFTVFSFVFLAYNKPFAKASDNMLSYLGNALVFTEMLVVLALRAGLAEENGWDSDLLGLALLGLNALFLGLVVASLVLSARMGGGADAAAGGGDKDDEIARLREENARLRRGQAVSPAMSRGASQNTTTTARTKTTSGRVARI